ncbi:hypothetical protein Tco_1121974 [Tanacetum coccineum]|uniref:Zinc finger PMZ-type domain-containing protein n=1 Tax=Tanacetum coccineum TaxID=301880 RepID=A0ABQ5IZ79_9ASTR
MEGFRNRDREANPKEIIEVSKCNLSKDNHGWYKTFTPPPMTRFYKQGCSGNEAEVDVSEDEWLRESLKKLPIKSKKGQQSSRKEVGQSSRKAKVPDFAHNDMGMLYLILGFMKRFLDCLGDELELFRNSNFTFRSDRGAKGRAKSNIFLNYFVKFLNRQLLEWKEQAYYHLSEKLQGIPYEENWEFQKKWELSGIPCTHAVASIWDQANNGIDTGIPESYCLPVHWLTTWKEMYKFKINPVNGPQGWKKSDVPTTIIPPKPHPQIGRPPKKRKKSAAELADEMMKSKKLTKTGK